MKKVFKRLIATVLILAVLAAIVVTLLFTLVNGFRFMTFSSAKVDKAVSVFNSAYDGGNVKLIAHRGLSAEEYQNTAAAFKLAAADKDVWAIETDVWVTADGKFICMHDADSLKGVDDVRSVTLQQALQIPLEKNFADEEKFANEYFAPSFEEYLDICKSGNKIAMIEIKDRNMTESELDGILSIVAQKGVEVNFGSFHFAKLKYIRLKDANVGLHLFTLTGLPRDMAEAGITSKDKMKALIAQRINLSCYWPYLTKSLAKQFHDAGLAVGVWTVNDSKTAACLVDEYGVNFVTTDKRKSALFA